MAKKFISLFLSIILLTSMFTGVVFAESKTAEVKQYYSLWFKTSGSAIEKITTLPIGTTENHTHSMILKMSSHIFMDRKKFRLQHYIIPAAECVEWC